MYYPPLCHLLPRLPATGRADAQQEELANLRSQNMTFTNDVRLNNVRLGADGPAAQSMGLLQFASTLHATQNVTQPKKEGDPAVAPAVAPFDAMAALRAMQAQPAGSFQGAQGGAGGAPLLGYGGAGGEEQWKTELEKRRKDKKRTKKEKKRERKAKMARKREKLVHSQGLSYEKASAMVADVWSEDSDSSSSSSS